MITGRLTASLFLVVSLVSIASYVLILGGVSQWTAEILQPSATARSCSCSSSPPLS